MTSKSLKYMKVELRSIHSDTEKYIIKERMIN